MANYGTSNKYINYAVNSQELSHDITSNTSIVKVWIDVWRTNTGYTTYGNGTVYARIDGNVYSAGITTAQKITSTPIRIGEWNVTIKHNDDGNKSIGVSGWIIHSQFSSSENGYTHTLSTIPRYAKINSFSVIANNETTLKYKYTTDVGCDYAWYSLDGGTTWKGLPTDNLIRGLNPNTSYSCKLRVRRTDSQLVSESSTISKSTYDYPHITSTPNFTIGDAVYCKLYNPLHRTVTVTMFGNDGSKIWSGTGWETYDVGSNNAENDIKNLYKSIPKTKSGKYYLTVKYGNITRTSGKGTYKCNDSKCFPTIDKTKVTYKDNNDDVVNVTGDNQFIVRNQSTLVITRTNGYATAKNYASIAKCEITFNGVMKTTANCDFGKVNLSNNANYTIKVTDSRGYTNSATKQIKILDWWLPKISGSATRLNNYEDEVSILINSTIASVNNKNTVKSIKCLYKEDTESDYTKEIIIKNNEVTKVALDKNKKWNIVIYVADNFATTSAYQLNVNKGHPVWFVDTKKLSVGVNCFPKEVDAFEVGGTISSRIGINNEIIKTDLRKVTDGTYRCLIKWTTLENGKKVGLALQVRDENDNALSSMIIKSDNSISTNGDFTNYGTLTANSLVANNGYISVNIPENSSTILQTLVRKIGNVSYRGRLSWHSSTNFHAFRFSTHDGSTFLSRIDVRTDGDVYVYATNNFSGNKAYSGSSDKRLKYDIQEIPSEFVDLWLELQPKMFRFKNDSDGIFHVGFIAQDVIELFSKYNLNYKDYGFVVTTKLYDDDDTEYFALTYEYFDTLTLLVSQKQQIKIEELDKRLFKIEELLKKQIIEEENEND